MKRSEILGVTERILEKAGFRLSQRCHSRPCCFDLAAQGEKKLIFLKIHDNIVSQPLGQALSLQALGPVSVVANHLTNADTVAVDRETVRLALWFMEHRVHGWTPSESNQRAHVIDRLREAVKRE